MKALIISGNLFELSSNIVLFLNKNVTVYVHTWDTLENRRWIQKLNRYKKYCSKIKVTVEPPKFEKKLYSYFYSTWKVVNMIDDIDKYSQIIKFKPNLDSTAIQYGGNLEEYFHKAYIQSRPLLKDKTQQECFYGSIYYQTMDERMFSGYPLGFKKVFHTLYKDFYDSMVKLDTELTSKYGADYEGSIFWKEYIEARGVKLIQDLDLRLPNNIN